MIEPAEAASRINLISTLRQKPSKAVLTQPHDPDDAVNNDLAQDRGRLGIRQPESNRRHGQFYRQREGAQEGGKGVDRSRNLMERANLKGRERHLLLYCGMRSSCVTHARLNVRRDTENDYAGDGKYSSSS